MKLVLTEKPSVGMDFVKALKDNFEKKDGYMIGNEWIITWAVGHLLRPKNPDEYHEKYKKWSMLDLPILPEKFSYTVNEKTKKQFKVVINQLKRNDVDEVYLATDAGREGELIGRLLIKASNIKKPIKRFWTSQALTPSVIYKGLNGAKDISSYNTLFEAGKSRQKADWLVGMNLTRAVSIKSDSFNSIGRVQTCILSIMVDRYEEIKNFKPKEYFELEGNFGFNKELIKARWFKKEDGKKNFKFIKKEEAHALLNQIKNETPIIDKYNKEKKSISPPLLFSLTELQREANKRFGFSAKKSLQIAQNLYEKEKCISYPRTDSRHLGDNSLEMVIGILKELKSKDEDLFKEINKSKITKSNKRVFNNSKLTDHHALIPLKAYQGSGDNEKIYKLIRNRFIAVFSNNYEYELMELTINLGKELFWLSGNNTIKKGWKLIDGGSSSELSLNVKEKQTGIINNLEVISKITTPPPEYNEASLLKVMSNPASLVENKDEKDIYKTEIGLGTQSTRASIIETLINREYVFRKNKNLICSEKGVSLINNLKNMPISKVICDPSNTARWELNLNNIYMNSNDPESFNKDIEEFVKSSVNEFKNSSNISVVTKEKISFGHCPKCNSNVFLGKKAFYCEKVIDKKCDFFINPVIAGKKLSEKMIGTLLSKKITNKIKGFKSKKGNKFDAKLKLENNKVEFMFD